MSDREYSDFEVSLEYKVSKGCCSGIALRSPLLGDKELIVDPRRPALALQLGHSSPFLFGVAVSPDGHLVLTGGSDNTARLWELGSGRELRSFRGHTDMVTSVAFSPDGNLVLTGSRDRTARLWDVATGESLSLQGHLGWVSSVTFSPDGKQALTGSADRTARLWDTATGREIRRLGQAVSANLPVNRRFPELPVPPSEDTAQGHTSRVSSVAFSPDGEQVLTGSWDRTARLWAVASGKLIHVLRGHGNYVRCVAFTNDGSQVVTGGVDGAIRFFDAATGKLKRGTRGGNGITSLALSPDGTHLVAGREDNHARMWDKATGKALRDFKGHEPRPEGMVPSTGPLKEPLVGEGSDRVEAIAFTPDSRQVLTGANDGTARLWDVATGNQVGVFCGRMDKVTSVAFSSDGNQVLAGSMDGGARLWDVAGGRQIRTFRVPGSDFSEVLSVAFSPDGKQVLTGHVGDGQSVLNSAARLWETASGKMISTFRWPRKAANFAFNYQGASVAFSADGKQLLTASDQAVLWDAASGNKLLTLPWNAGFSAVAFSPDGKYLLTAGADTRMSRYEQASNRFVVRGGVDTGAYLWSAATGKQIRAFEGLESDNVPLAERDSALARKWREMPGHIAGLTSAAFSPDGKLVLTGSDDQTARLWEAATGKQVRLFGANAGKVKAVAYSRDGRHVLTGGEDWTARLWEAATGKQVRLFKGHAGGVTSVAISPDGKLVLTGSWDGTTRLWQASSGRELCAWISFRDDSWVAVTPENYYTASRGLLEGVAFRVGKRAYPFEQFDLKYNRPDLVLDRIGLAPKEFIAANHQAYQKRLKKLNFTEDMLADDFHLPEVAVVSAVPLSVEKKTLQLKVRATDATTMLDRLNVLVNGSPVGTANGISLRQKKTKSLHQEVDIDLSQGKNTIQVSVLNENGVESLTETREVVCVAPAVKPDLYAVVIGISDYRDANNRLTYADKDANDLADFLQLSLKGGFGKVEVTRILNREATKENLLRAKETLAKSRVDDLVIVFLAGHGLLSKQFDYYFATADIDFQNPAKRGLPYEAIESLFDGVRARRKVLLMDTCHSGEVDKEDLELAMVDRVPEGQVKGRGFRGLALLKETRLASRESRHLLQNLFADLRRGTGTVVISAAAGMEFALEGVDGVKNGVFTHSVLQALKGKKADRNKDGRIQVSELQDYVVREVSRLTRGQQTPTARRENLTFDFTLD